MPAAPPAPLAELLAVAVLLDAVVLPAVDVAVELVEPLPPLPPVPLELVLPLALLVLPLALLVLPVVPVPVSAQRPTAGSPKTPRTQLVPAPPQSASVQQYLMHSSVPAALTAQCSPDLQNGPAMLSHAPQSNASLGEGKH
jgi:hypothetical protein